MTLDEIRELKANGKLKEMKPDAPEYILPDEFWKNAQVKKVNK